MSSIENNKQNVTARLYQCIPHQNQIILCKVTENANLVECTLA
jgi:hypothetical protein